MIWVALGFIWRRLGNLRWPLLWIISPKYTLGVNAIIVNDSDEVWLQQHRFWPNKDWGLPGGIVKANESPEKALARELMEEVGLEVDNLTLFSTELFYRRGLALCYSAKFKSGEMTLDSKELLDGKYFKADSLPHNTLTGHANLIQLYFRKGSAIENKH